MKACKTCVYFVETEYREVRSKGKEYKCYKGMRFIFNEKTEGKNCLFYKKNE